MPKPIVHNIVADPVPALSPRLHHASDTHASTLRQIVSPASCLAAFCPYAFVEEFAPVSSLDGQHSVIGAVKASQLAGRRGLPSPLSLPKRRSPVMVKHFICPQPRGKGCGQHPKHEAGLPPLWRNGWDNRTSFPPCGCHPRHQCKTSGAAWSSCRMKRQPARASPARRSSKPCGTREQIGSTALGRGVALPHAELEGTACRSSSSPASGVHRFRCPGLMSRWISFSWSSGRRGRRQGNFARHIRDLPGAARAAVAAGPAVGGDARGGGPARASADCSGPGRRTGGDMIDSPVSDSPHYRFTCEHVISMPRNT